MITKAVFQRTYFIKYGDSTGTAFTIDHEKKQYLVTARHVVSGIQNPDTIFVYHEQQWKNATITIVGLGVENDIATDVAVLALEIQISPSYDLVASSEDLVWGQEVFFLGFPYGLHTAVDVNDGYPLAIVKGARMAGSIGRGGKKPEIYLLDGFNNPGFSGGPVVFRPKANPEADFRVMGVVSGYQTEDVKITFQGEPTGLTSKANTGLIVCPSIKQVVELIAANPKGADVKS